MIRRSTARYFVRPSDITFIVLPLIKGYIAALRRRKPVSEHAVLDLATVLVTRTTPLFLVAVALWVGSMPLDMPPHIHCIFGRALLLMWWLQVGIWAVAAASYFIDRKRGAHVDRGFGGSLDIIHFVARLLIWALVLLVALDKDMGTVERIGVKSTRLRSIDGEQIIVSNADLLKARVHNFGRMYERRVLFTISVRYETPVATVREIAALLAGIVREQKRVRLDHSHFARYGDFALIYEVVYFVLDPDFNFYMDVQQALNIRILEEFEKRGIVFSYRERQPAAHARRAGPTGSRLTASPPQRTSTLAWGGLGGKAFSGPSRTGCPRRSLQGRIHGVPENAFPPKPPHATTDALARATRSARERCVLRVLARAQRADQLAHAACIRARAGTRRCPR